jgi:hypothetical protein
VRDVLPIILQVSVIRRPQGPVSLRKNGAAEYRSTHVR